METKEKARKTYKKPQINQVKLVIEEAVLQACKASYGDTAGKSASGKFCGANACKLSYGS
jgi:hypothetical protein